jgi:hypothetical protein
VQEYLAVEEVGSRSDYPRPSPYVDVVAQVKEFVDRQHIGAVLVNISAINAAEVGNKFSRALGPPTLTSGGFELWVTGRSTPT